MTIENTIVTAEADAKADLAYGTALLAPAVTDIKTVAANRVGDVLIAVVVLGAVWIGHLL